MSLAEEFRAGRLEMVEKENARLREECARLNRELLEIHKLYESSTKRRHIYRQCISAISRLVEEVDR